MTQEVAIGLIFAILVIAAVAVPWFITRSRRRERRRYEHVPPALRPAYSDEQLEKTVVERYMGWGLVLTALFAVFFPIYWVQEANRIRDAEAGLFTSSVASGEALYTDNCAECHGDTGRGGATASPHSPDGTWPAPDLLNMVERYEENPNVDDVRQYVRDVIERGRPGTPMPAWGMAFQGPLTDIDIDAIVDWIMVSQVSEETEEAATTDATGEELFAANCAKCHGTDGLAQAGPSLVGVFERHNEETIMGILRDGIIMSDGLSMPPWQNGYTYEGANFDDETLERIVDYLEELQPEELPEDAGEYRTPGVREDGSEAPRPGAEEEDDEDADGEDDGDVEDDDETADDHTAPAAG